MGKISKEEYILAKKQKTELLKLILQKTGVKHRDIVEDAERDFIRFNLDVVTPSERKLFDKLVF
jgi:arsenate reductase-like glutaredoxin family protein